MSKLLLRRYINAIATDGENRIELDTAKWDEWERMRSQDQWLWKLTNDDPQLVEIDEVLQTWLEHSGLYPVDRVFYETRCNLLWLRAQLGIGITLYTMDEFIDKVDKDAWWSRTFYGRPSYDEKKAFVRTLVNRYNEGHLEDFAILIDFKRKDSMETDPEMVMVIDLRTLVYCHRLLTSTPIEKRLADGLKLNRVMQFKDDKLWNERPFELKDLLEERGMSVYRLTKDSGLSNRTVERVVKGEQSIGQMSLDNADALAHALGYENASELKKDLAFRNRRYTF